MLCVDRRHLLELTNRIRKLDGVTSTESFLYLELCKQVYEWGRRDVVTADVRLEALSKHFDDVVAVDDLSLEVEEGRFFALLGPSGCGKTTTFTVKARLVGFDRHLEEAAMDLGANEVTTFRKITLPLIAPAMVAAALLGFALSIDDFVITYLVAGGEQTFPLYVWGIARVATPPQVNVVASAFFLIAIAVALGNVIWQYRSARRQQGAATA